MKKYLHDNDVLFDQLSELASLEFDIKKEYIIHDYWCSFILKGISENIPNIIFKGGTSLSKCFGVINRYSEDIDLNLIQKETPTHKVYKEFHHKLFKTIEDLGLEILNKDQLRSGSKVNAAFVRIGENKFSQIVKVETYLVLKSFPVIQKEVSSYIGKYLLKSNKIEILQEYNLGSFLINTQKLERTFIDKLFAICDYYEGNYADRNSRHLYDLCKLKPYISFDENFKKLFEQVRLERQNGNAKIVVSARDGYDIKKTLRNILDKDFYKQDFRLKTKTILFEKVTYGQIKKELNNIINEFEKIDIFYK